MATPISSPILPTYASRIPYLTSAEYVNSPTGVDVSQLVVGGTTQQNADALTQTIARASAAVDTHCRQILAATLDIQADRYRIKRGGYIRVPLDRTPILQVTDISLASTMTPALLTSMPDLSGVMIRRKTLEIPVYQATLPNPWGSSSTSGFDDIYAVISYVNGYANCLMAGGGATAGGNTVTVDNPVGIIPGVLMTAYDPGQTEAHTVLSVVGNVVTINGTWANAHAAGVSFSALPPEVKEATVLYTSALIKTRSDDAIEMPQIGAQASTVSHAPEVNGPEIALANILLTDHVRIV